MEKCDVCNKKIPDMMLFHLWMHDRGLITEYEKQKYFDYVMRSRLQYGFIRVCEACYIDLLSFNPYRRYGGRLPNEIKEPVRVWF